MKYFSLLLFFLLAVQSTPAEARQAITNGHELIDKMYDTYEGKWYKHLKFTQKTTFYNQDGTVQRVQNWYEALSLPGKLAIKFDTEASKNGILFNNGIQYGYANGQLVQEVDREHELLLLGFDVYHQEPEITAVKLINLGFDLDKIYEDEWQGRPVYVVGTDAPDSTVAQFWIDKERLYFVRNIVIGRYDTVQEVQFNKYERLGQGWIAPEVIFKANNFIGLLEEYTQILIPDTLDQEIFNPVMYTETVW